MYYLCRHEELTLHVEEAITRPAVRAGKCSIERWSLLIQELYPRLKPAQRKHVLSHARQVRGLANEMAIRLALHQADRLTLNHAALLHDAGKCVMPEDLLTTKENLTPLDRWLLGRHAECGAEIARRLGAEADVVEQIRAHHHPYEFTLTSSQQRISDILRLADTIDAMMMDRGYQRSRSSEEVRNELLQAEPQQYSPEVIQAALCLDLFHVTTTRAA